MTVKTVVRNALKYHLTEIQIDCKYDWEEEKKYIDNLLSYIEKGGEVDKEWLLADATYFLNVIDQYNNHLKEQLKEMDSLFDDVEGVKQERRVLNRLHSELAESSQ